MWIQLNEIHQAEGHFGYGIETDQDKIGLYGTLLQSSIAFLILLNKCINPMELIKCKGVGKWQSVANFIKME